MKRSRLFVVACLVAVGMLPAIAQEPPRLLFEVAVDGSIVATPEMRVPSGDEGRLELSRNHGQERVTFTPTVRGEDIAILFDITSGDEQFRPSLVITKTVRGALEWTSRTAGQTFRLTVSWVE
jgi:hypothetical protein